jgi:hypothetical protein
MLLALSKSSTDTALDLSEYALLFFGLVLVAGIFGEYKKVPKRIASWPKAVFEILVMVGVAGELLGDGGVFAFSRALQTISDRDLAEMKNRLELSTATLSADMHFMDAISTANQDALHLEISKVEQEAARFNEVAERERLARVKVEEQLAWRTLSPVQKETLVAAMRPFPGTRVHITCIVGDAEGGAYAEDFDEIVRRAGWKTTEVSPSGMLVQGSAPHGLILEYRDLKGAAETLLAALTEIGIKPSAVGPTEQKGYDIVLEIGVKPRPGQNARPSKGSVIIDLPVENPK